MKSYTDEDVERLVKAATTIVADRDTWNGWAPKAPVSWVSIDDLSKSLAPFRPDPDTELIQKVNDIRRVICPNLVSAGITNQIIAAVREHDARQGGDQ